MQVFFDARGGADPCNIAATTNSPQTEQHMSGSTLVATSNLPPGISDLVAVLLLGMLVVRRLFSGAAGGPHTLGS